MAFDFRENDGRKNVDFYHRFIQAYALLPTSFCCVVCRIDKRNYFGQEKFGFALGGVNKTI